ncbi:ATP-dependent RNA helicase-like protein DB10 [Elaeis guineensis]|uniref:ATP-dependent RNA helicase-like protein DB10 n=1 Tax=Elaeis guineensis var. tenera TaxID=51953 RepID=UPI003C6CCA60
MTAAASRSSSKGPRYAPEDPTLPKPWRGLIDGNTGYLYFWNPKTNITQYERPLAESFPPSSPETLGSSFHQQQQQPPSSSGHRGSHEYEGSRDDQYPDARGGHSPSLNGLAQVGHGSSSHGHNAQSSRAAAQGHGLLEGRGGSSAEAYRRQHEITVTGDDVPVPFTSFESTGFPSEILREVHRAGFSAPTPIQAQSWPIALNSRDIVAIAKTGSGKTLGYLIPGFIHLKHLHNDSKMGPTVLVLSPTRELATQIQDEAVKFGRSSRISCVCLYGGASKGPQLRDLDRGADVVVATPGRLNDILEMRRVSLHQVSYLVLDEADRMLDMGFEPQIRKIVKEIPARRQTLMFTATWPKEVRKIAADLLVNSVQVNIGNIDELVANKSIIQYVEVITPMEKSRRLEQILRSQEPGSRIIIFCSTKRMCDQLARNLTRQFGAAAIHGDKSQVERDWVLSQFRMGKSPILVATDVAARGLDIKDIRVVINYDFPTGVEDYVHRIGRTGRAGASGVAYTFFCDQDSKYASDLVKVLEGAGQHVPSELLDMVSRGGYGGKSRRWGSGARDGGRSHGGLAGSSYGGKNGWGLPLSSGWSESFRGGGGGNGDHGSSHDRYGYGGQDDRRDRGSGGGRAQSRRSISPSPPRGTGGCDDSRGRSWNRGCSRSRSRSRSCSRGLSTASLVHRQSPPPRKEPPMTNYSTSDRVHSPTPYFQQQQLGLPEHNKDMREAQLDHSPSLQKERPLSLDEHTDAVWERHCHSGEPKGHRLDNGEEEEEGIIQANEDGIVPLVLVTDA